MTRGRIASALVMAAFVAALTTGCGSAAPVEVTIGIQYSGFDPARITVPHGVPVTINLVNHDPIDHEWIIGDEALHEMHRTGTHPSHDELPTEVTIPALETATTVITFNEPGSYSFICHLPLHEGYGMVGTMTVT